MLDFIKDSALWLTAVAAALGVLTGAVAWWWKRGRRIAGKIDGALDALVGRPDILHPDTGEVLAPATPGLGVRLATIETALVGLAETHLAMGTLSARVESVEGRVVVLEGYHHGQTQGDVSVTTVVRSP